MLYHHPSYLYGYLGNPNPEVLKNLSIVLGLNFGLRAVQEHCNLRMKSFQLSFGIDEDGKHYLEYNEYVSKTDSVRLAHARLKRKTVRVYENNDEPERCPVKLYKGYMPRVPEGALSNSFYLRPLKEPKGDICCNKIASGRETLESWKTLVLKGITVIIHGEKHAPLNFMTKVFLSS